MGSSDWMTRNLHHRIEVCMPVKDPVLATEFTDYFEIQWNDNCKSSPVETEIPLHTVQDISLKTELTRCAQQEIYNYLKNRQ
jgi:polyphosphate kinase